MELVITHNYCIVYPGRLPSLTNLFQSVSVRGTGVRPVQGVSPSDRWDWLQQLSVMSVSKNVEKDGRMTDTCDIVSKPHCGQGDNYKIGRLQESPLLHLLENQDRHCNKE